MKNDLLAQVTQMTEELEALHEKASEAKTNTAVHKHRLDELRQKLSDALGTDDLDKARQILMNMADVAQASLQRVSEAIESDTFRE